MTYKFAGFDDLANNDLGKTRYVTFGDISVKFTCAESPFGLWSIIYSKSNTPWELQGSYTTFDYAYKALAAYAAKHKRAHQLGEIVRPDLHTKAEALAKSA